MAIQESMLARRSGETWYVAGNNATGKELTLKLSLPMLSKGDQVTLYSDNLKNREPECKEFKVTGKPISITMADQGGFVMVK